MSLLNDALRKKRGERFQTRELSGPESLTPGSMFNRKRQWFAVSSGIALLALASAVWLFLYASPPVSGSAGSQPPQYPERIYADHQTHPQATGSAFTTSQDASVSPVSPAMAVAAAPVAPAVHAAESGRAAVDPESSPAASSSADDKDSSGTGNDGLRKHPTPDPVLEARSPQQPISPEPEAPSSDTAREESSRDSDRLFQRACQYHRRHGLDQAIALYQNVLKKDPKHAQARFNLVAAYLQTGAYAQAYSIAAKLLSEDPSNRQIMLNLAIAHIGCGRDRQALGLLEKAEKLPDAPLFEIVFHKAVALGHLGRLKGALDCYRRAESMRPDDPGLLFNMALAYDQKQQYKAAVDYYLKYLEHAPEGNTLQIKQIRRRVRILQAYGAEEKLKE